MFNYLLGRRDFNSKEKVVNVVKNFDRYNERELLDSASALLIFKSDIQQCWLVFTNLRMYFVIDDTEQGILKALWARDKENIVVDGRVALHLKEEAHSKETGKLLFGNMNNSIMFTHSLFNGVSISGAILSIAQKHFIGE